MLPYCCFFGYCHYPYELVCDYNYNWYYCHIIAFSLVGILVDKVIDACVSMYVRVYVRVYVYVYMCVCVFLYLYVYVYVCKRNPGDIVNWDTDGERVGCGGTLSRCCYFECPY